MGDRPLDDNRPPAPQPRPQREPGAYYYDDQTGYEPYDPSSDEDDEVDDARGDGQAPEPDRKTPPRTRPRSL